MLGFQLRPMLLQTMCCSVCGRALREGERDDAADDDKLAAISQLQDTRPIVQCPKCGKLTRNRKVVNKVFGRKVV